jgi:hypothetical protein
VLVELRHWGSAYEERGLRVIAVDADSDNGEAFPEVVICLAKDGVDGERVLRYSLEHLGQLENPADASRNVAILLLELTRAEIVQLPHAS